MICTKCKSDLSQDAKFCSSCGLAVPKPVIQEKQSIPDIMTLNEVADFLRTSRWTIYQLLRTSNLPFFQVGRRKRFLRSEVVKWANANGMAA